MKIVPVFAVCLLLFFSCTTPPPKALSFADDFQAMPAQDTLHFAVDAGLGTDAPLASADTLSEATFNRAVSDSLRLEIEHILEGGDPVIVKLGQFSLDEQYAGLGIDIKASWFRNQSLLIYDTKAQKVIDLLPVAEFYGGDGSQRLQSSWLFTNSDGSKNLIVRASWHSLQLDENSEEPQDIYTEEVAKYLWQNGHFVPQPVQDSSALIKAFPIDWNF